MAQSLYKTTFSLIFSNLLGFSVSLLMNSIYLNYFFNPRFLLQLIFNCFPLGAVLYMLFISLKSCIHLSSRFYLSWTLWVPCNQLKENDRFERLGRQLIKRRQESLLQVRASACCTRQDSREVGLLRWRGGRVHSEGGAHCGPAAFRPTFLPVTTWEHSLNTRPSRISCVALKTWLCD